MPLDIMQIYNSYRGGRDAVKQNRLAEMEQTFRQQQLGLQERNLAGDERYRAEQIKLEREKMAMPDLTDDMKEYNFAKTQGFTGSFNDYMTGLKKAGGTNISIDQRGENEFQKKLGGLQAERVNSLIESGSESKQMVGAINQLRDIGSRITTGKTTEILTALGPYAEAAGIKIDGLDDAQAYDAIISRLAPQMRVPGSGATSDFEMGQFLKSLPGLGKTPEGNKLIQDSLEGIAQWKQAAAGIASKAARGEISRDQMEEEIQALPDPLTLWRKGQRRGPTGQLKSDSSGQPVAAAPQGSGEITIDLEGNILK